MFLYTFQLKLLGVMKINCEDWSFKNIFLLNILNNFRQIASNILIFLYFLMIKYILKLAFILVIFLHNLEVNRPKWNSVLPSMTFYRIWTHVLLSYSCI